MTSPSYPHNLTQPNPSIPRYVSRHRVIQRYLHHIPITNPNNPSLLPHSPPNIVPTIIPRHQPSYLSSTIHPQSIHNTFIIFSFSNEAVQRLNKGDRRYTCHPIKSSPAKPLRVGTPSSPCQVPFRFGICVPACVDQVLPIHLTKSRLSTLDSRISKADSGFMSYMLQIICIRVLQVSNVQKSSNGTII